MSEVTFCAVDDKERANRCGWCVCVTERCARFVCVGGAGKGRKHKLLHDTGIGCFGEGKLAGHETAV